jgi:conjugal transfer/type IV secretion protein DotA/TraY
MKIKKIVFLALCIICPEVLAAIFDVSPSDRSKQYLGTIFGGSVGNISLSGDFNPTLSLMFERFNFIIVTVGITMLSYTGIMSVINTAREGEAMGKKLSLWVPLRSILGMLLMVPGPTSGYSIVQMTVLWIVLNGVGAANQVWGVVLDQLARGVQATGTIEMKLHPNDLKPTATKILYASVCMSSINNYMTNLFSPTGPLRNQSKVRLYTQRFIDYSLPTAASYAEVPDNTTITRSAIVNVGIQDAADPNLQSLCGSFTVTATLTKQPACNPANGTICPNVNTTFNTATLAKKLNIKIAALSAMFTALEPAAQILADPNPITDQFTPPDPGYMSAAGTAYLGQLSQLATGLQVAATPLSGNAWEQTLTPPQPTNIYQIIKSLGWIHAGSYYYTMARSTIATLDPETIPPFQGPTANPEPPSPTISGTSQSDISADITLPAALNNIINKAGSMQTKYGPLTNKAILVTGINRAYNYTLTDSGIASGANALTVGNRDTGNGIMNALVNTIGSAIRNPMLNYLSKISNNGTDDPLLSIGQFGSDLMLVGETSVFAGLIIALGISLGSSAVSCMSPFAWGFNFLFMQLIPAMYALLIIMWTMGATLGIYTPLVPYLIFTTTAFGWLIAVTEAVVGAPLIALGLVHPTGEELGQASKALAIVANLFLRPTLMIFGFVLGAGILRAAIQLVNFGFVTAVGQSTVPTLFSIIPVVGIYTMLIIGLVNKSFSLIYMLPNQIMRWMGGAPEEGGGSPAELIGEAKKGFEGGSKFAHEGLEQGRKTAIEKWVGKEKKKSD